MPKVVWLSSYPKSGNTWMRTFLRALQNTGPVNLNRLGSRGMFSIKQMIESMLDVNPDWFHDHENEQLQRVAYSHFFKTHEEQHIIKIHDAYTYSKWDGLPLIPLQPDHLVVYIVRNPVDVVPSFANHNNMEAEFIIDKIINNPAAGLSRIRNSKSQFHQPLGTWSMHVESWLSQTVSPVHVVRYEDMKARPFDTFKEVVSKMGLTHTDEEIKFNIDRTSFEVVKELEKEQGFREKLHPDSTFFLHGKVGRGVEVLTPDQIERVRTAHSISMKHLNYD